MTGKRFTRYYQDPGFRSAVDEQFARADAATSPGSWITYAIHDPNRIDHIAGEPDGLIIYVGQSKNFRTRIRKRMKAAGTAMSRPRDRIGGACYDIMSQGAPPCFSVRERTHSAVDSLISETNTAKQLLRAGYPLLNQWAEQKFAGLDIDRFTVPFDWLWPMTAADAIGSEIDLILRDRETGEEMVADLSTFPPDTRLREIKALLKDKGLAARLHVR
jgi:hypothetical protein